MLQKIVLIEKVLFWILWLFTMLSQIAITNYLHSERTLLRKIQALVRVC